MFGRMGSTFAAFPILLFVSGTAAAVVPTPPTVIFSESWENGTSGWQVNTANDNPAGQIDDGSIVVAGPDALPACTTRYQHETISASGGRVFTATPISVTAGTSLCLTAWVRGSQSPQASFAIGYATLADGLEVASWPILNAPATDGTWQWLTGDFTVSGSGSVAINLGDELYVNGATTAPPAGEFVDFDDITIWQGSCASVSTLLGGAPDTHQTCSGATPACDNDSTDKGYGTCTACSINSDCSATPATPICSSSVCVACAADSDCTSDALPFCSGNVCSACTASTQCATHGAKSVCDTDGTQGAAGSCVACAANSDCSSVQPVCSTTANTCGGCSVLGDCSVYAGTVCNATSGACVQCVGDGDCGGTGNVCDTGTNTCVAGCRGGGSPIGCPAGQFCTSEGATRGMCSTTCDFDNQCTGGLFCAASSVDAGPSNCVQCRNSADCTTNVGHTVCATGTFVCVECTSGSAGACSAAGNGSACLANQSCGCTVDADCGGSTSGRICNGATNHCTTGCRGTGGNGCPSTMLCSSGNGSPGTCGAIPDTDMAMAVPADMSMSGPADMSMSAGDMSPIAVAADMAQAPNGSTNTLSGGGAGCSLGGDGNLGGAWLLLAVGFALALRRRYVRVRA